MSDGALRCSSEGCGRDATEALGLRGQPGHVHDCPEHAHDLREWCDVLRSAPLDAGRCPWPCTADPIAVGQPTPLEATDE